MKTAILNGPVFDGESVREGLAVVLQDQRIVDICSEEAGRKVAEEVFDLDGRLLAPGLIDLQVNGGGGVLFNDAPSVAAIKAIGAAHRRFGTTGFLPTLISTDRATMHSALEAVGEAITQGVPGVLGIHFEGPFLNPKFKGVHQADNFCTLDEEAFELLTSLSNGQVLLTIAPETTSDEMISRLCEAGIIVFAGHSAADYTQTRAAMRAGVRGFTHLFNAMTQFGSRDPGMVGAALADRHSWAGVIADGQHVHPAALAVAVAAKQHGGIILVTDAMPTVGSQSDSFVLDGSKIRADGGACRTAAGHLAGSNLDMITAVKNIAQFADIDRMEALRMASSYPAQALGLEHRIGCIRPGFQANLIALDEDFNVCSSWIDGQRSLVFGE